MPLALTKEEERTAQQLLRPIYNGSLSDFLKSDFTILFRESKKGMRPTNQDVINLNSYHKIVPFLACTLLMRHPMLKGSTMEFEVNSPDKNVEAIFAKYQDVELDEEDIIYSYGAINNYFGEFAKIENDNFIVTIESDEGEHETRKLYMDNYSWGFKCSYKIAGEVENTCEWTYEISKSDDEILSIENEAKGFFQTVIDSMIDLMKESFRKEISN